MGDFFGALAEGFVQWIEERFGTAAAWIAAVVAVLVPIGLLIGAALWYMR